MTDDSPLWAFEIEMLCEITNFKEKGLVIPEEGEEEKGI